MSTTATLTYTVAPVAPVSLTRTENALGGVTLPFSDMVNFGATFVSDNTTNDGTNAVRTIQFNISSAQFQANFPAGQEASPFNNLYTTALGAALGMKVTAGAVIIA